eukprot:763515-Hanusia_phi.AAC.2
MIGRNVLRQNLFFASMAEQEEQIFNLTNRVREAVMLINDIQESKLAIMVRRLARKVGVKGDAFSKEELAQLQEHLNVSANEIDTIVEACSFFLERSAYHVIKADLVFRPFCLLVAPYDMSEQLASHLQEAGLIPSHVSHVSSPRCAFVATLCSIRRLSSRKSGAVKAKKSYGEPSVCSHCLLPRAPPHALVCRRLRLSHNGGTKQLTVLPMIGLRGSDADGCCLGHRLADSPQDWNDRDDSVRPLGWRICE